MIFQDVLDFVIEDAEEFVAELRCCFYSFYVCFVLDFRQIQVYRFFGEVDVRNADDSVFIGKRGIGIECGDKRVVARGECCGDALTISASVCYGGLLRAQGCVGRLLAFFQ